MEAKLLKEEKEEELGGDAGTQRLFRTIYAGARACPLALPTLLSVHRHGPCFSLSDEVWKDARQVRAAAEALALSSA